MLAKLPSGQRSGDPRRKAMSAIFTPDVGLTPYTRSVCGHSSAIVNRPCGRALYGNQKPDVCISCDLLHRPRCRERNAGARCDRPRRIGVDQLHHRQGADSRHARLDVVGRQRLELQKCGTPVLVFGT